MAGVPSQLRRESESALGDLWPKDKVLCLQKTGKCLPRCVPAARPAVSVAWGAFLEAGGDRTACASPLG